MLLMPKTMFVPVVNVCVICARRILDAVTVTFVSLSPSDNLGSSILYLWIERIREFLEELQETTPDIGKSFLKSLRILSKYLHIAKYLSSRMTH